jgi:hypothetical protein
MDMDFPAAPVVGQMYTAPSGVTYVFDGQGWTIGFYDSTTQQLTVVGDILDQVRTLLQDVDNSSGQYRYSTDSIVTALNQGMIDLFRMRPDIYLSQQFKVPTFSVAGLDVILGIEEQYVSPLVFYVVGLVQARDDEQTQDARAQAFLTTFKGAVLTVN